MICAPLKYAAIKHLSFISLQVQIENDKLRRDRESRGSRIDLSNLCVSSNATTIVNTMRQQNEQKATSRSIRNLSGLIIDSQGNSIPLSPVSSNTSSSSSDNVVEEHHKPTPMTPSGTTDYDINYPSPPSFHHWLTT